MSSNINFSDEEIKDILKQNLTGPHQDLLSDALLGLLDGAEWKHAHLVKATLGIRPMCKHRLYEEYLIPLNSVSEYGIDKKASREAGYINADNKIKAILTTFNPWSSSQYLMKYEFINDKGAIAHNTYSLNKRDLIVAEEFPEGYDDLPF